MRTIASLIDCNNAAQLYKHESRLVFKSPLHARLAELVLDHHQSKILRLGIIYVPMENYTLVEKQRGGSGRTSYLA